MSMVAGPPASQIRMTPSAFRLPGPCPARASWRQHIGQAQAEQAGGADPEEVAAVEALAVGPMVA